MFIHQLRVRYGECDPQGIVFNANYIAYLDVAFTELWREAVGPWSQMADEWGVDAVVASMDVEFRSPAHFDDVIAIEMSIISLGTTSISTAVRVVRDAQLLMEGSLRHVIVERHSWQPTEIPAAVRSGLERFRG